MIVFRQVDGRYPPLWEGPAQPEGRWHADGEGPAHYFFDTPDGAWAEFLRHEEITEGEDLETIRRRMWAVEIGNAPRVAVTVSDHQLGGPDTYLPCQQEARRLRAAGADRIAAPSAALTGSGQSGVVIVVFGSTTGLSGSIAADAARPAAGILQRVRHYRSS